MLPAGWWRGLTRDRRRAVIAVERAADAGRLVLSGPDHKGYWWVSLCSGHPYANQKGMQRLHRYVMMRRLGRRLESWEHVHHRRGAALDTTDIRDLVLMEELHHGRYHYGERIRCGEHVALWTPRDHLGRFTPLPDKGLLDMVPF